MNKQDTGYATVKAQQAFLNLPPDDQQALELQHWIAADAMNIVHNQYCTVEKVDSILLRPVADLGLTVRSMMVLQNQHIDYAGQLIQLTPKELGKFPNCGKFVLKNIEGVLNELGLQLGTKLSDKENELLKSYIG